MIFRRVLTERISIGGAYDDLPAAKDWCAKNGFVLDDQISHDANGDFILRAVRLINDGRRCTWTVKAKQPRRKP